MKPFSRLLIATTNPGKIAELKSLMTGIEIVALTDLPAAPEVVEDGATYRDNALKKALAYHRWSGLPALADDSGLEVDALDGAPGVFSARFGGEQLSWPERWKYLQDRLHGVDPSRWVARFRCILCFVDDNSTPVFFEGVTEGRVLPAPRGQGGFGYDPVVFSNELGMSFAEAPAEAKNRVSHRAKALRAFRDWLDRSGRRG